MPDDVKDFISGECKRDTIYNVRWEILNDESEVVTDCTGALGLAHNIHSDSPQLEVNKDYTIPLCIHEYKFLRGLPGKEYSYYWKFTVKEAGKLSYTPSEEKDR